MIPSGFTIKSGGILRVLESSVTIHEPRYGNRKITKAIWDTGATGSVITRSMVSELGLIPTGAVEVHTANGTAFQRTYIINIGLPNGVLVEGLVVTEVSRLNESTHALIGMDIITLGDLSITNFNGHTCMSFRIPSLHEIDFFSSPQYGT